jgi:thiol-disulfide isomerase/thioredoxin
MIGATLRMPKSIALGWLVLIGSLTSTAQDLAKASSVRSTFTFIGNTKSEIQPLTIGDKVPELLLTNIYNYSSRTAKLSDFKGKLLILDFWATWCNSCVETFPKMHSLQKKFGEQLQIILINTYVGDNEKKVNDYFFKRRVRTGETVELPYILQDSTLPSYFPHKYIPHYVWIDKNMKVVAITSQSEITENNIHAVLEGKNILFHTKDDKLVYDGKRSILTDGQNVNEFLYRSVITGYKEGLGSVIGSIPDKDGKVTKFYVINYPLLALFQLAYRDVFKYPKNRIVLETSRITMEQLNSSDQKKLQNNYCYEVVAAPVSRDDMIKYMQEDLSRNFKLVAKTEIRSRECLSLVANSQIKKALTKGGEPGSDIGKSSLRKHIRNKSVSVLIELLNLISDKPVVDETFLSENVDIDLPYDIYSYDIVKVKEFLHSIGFDLKDVKKELEVSLITDK